LLLLEEPMRPSANCYMCFRWLWLVQARDGSLLGEQHCCVCWGDHQESLRQSQKGYEYNIDNLVKDQLNSLGISCKFSQQLYCNRLVCGRLPSARHGLSTAPDKPDTRPDTSTPRQGFQQQQQ
jgi:hypothetical protein